MEHGIYSGINGNENSDDTMKIFILFEYKQVLSNTFGTACFVAAFATYERALRESRRFSHPEILETEVIE